MGHLPGKEGIIEDCFIIFAIAHTYYVSTLSRDSFGIFPYMRRESAEIADRLLIEKLLGLAAKVRFLDDQTDVLKKFDRKLPRIGKHYIEGNRIDDVDIRKALNKLIHHKKISIILEDTNTMVLNGGKDTGDLKIPAGHYNERHAIIEIEGIYNNKEWKFELDLFFLLNEIQRVFYLQQGNPPYMFF